MERGSKEQRHWFSNQISVGNILTIVGVLAHFVWSYVNLYVATEQNTKEAVKLEGRLDKVEEWERNFPTRREMDELKEDIRALRSTLDEQSFSRRNR